MYKWCLVPGCTNTTIKTPEKLFVCVPKKPKVRKMWLKLASRNPDSVVDDSTVFFYEDRFNRMGLLAALAVNAVGGAVIYATGGLGAAWVAPMLGFGNSGIAAGSVAAAAQSYYGNVAAGSVIAKMTAVAMAAPTP